jgi:peptidyl-prolyl isomerase D
MHRMPQGGIKVVDHRMNNELGETQSSSKDKEQPAHLAEGEATLTERGDATCRQETNAEYDGDYVVVSGANHVTQTSDACCEACRKEQQCNVWVWCGNNNDSGCSGDRAFGECWLKRASKINPSMPKGLRGSTLGWVSGTLLTVEEHRKAVESFETAEEKEKRRLNRLRDNTSLPLVYFDVEIKGQAVGRIEFVLFVDISPRCAENFRRFVTGESGVAPEGSEGAGLEKHFKGAPFYRIIDQFIDQSGVATESSYGGQFKDDPGGLKLKHEHKGLLSMANMGPDTNTNHFSIMMNPAPHLDGHYTIFGQAVSGFDVIDAINALSKDKPDRTATAEDGAVIKDCGEIRRGAIQPDLKLGITDEQ